MSEVKEFNTGDKIVVVDGWYKGRVGSVISNEDSGGICVDLRGKYLRHWIYNKDNIVKQEKVKMKHIKAFWRYLQFRFCVIEFVPYDSEPAGFKGYYNLKSGKTIAYLHKTGLQFKY